MRFYFTFILLSILALVSGCSKNGGGDSPAAAVVGINGGIVSIPAGTYAVVGTLNVNPNCGTTVANVTLSSGYSTGQTIGSAQVGTGGSFSFPVPATGAYPYSSTSYYLTVTAGTCNVAGQVAALTNGQQPYSVCLGQAGVCGGGTSTGYYGGYPPYYKAAAKANGVIQAAFTGTGDFAISSTDLYLTAKKAGSFSISLVYSSGNNVMNVSPGVVEGAWKGSIAADGSLKVGDASVDHLSYGSQVDASLLSYDQSFCGSAADAIQKMQDYAQSADFSAKAIAGMKADWDAHSIANNVCVYPQDGKVADSVVTYKSDSKIDANRAWFAVVPSGDVAGKKFVPSEKIAKLTSKAKVGTLVAAKKVLPNRKLASDNDLLAEELGFGFLIQK